MSDTNHQVLARKWRPRTFSEMVGQEHVLRALINSLDHNRLHHAYLFSGTRGVGKTSIARILAKCLNCEQGVSSVPCDQCSACTEITQGRFVDLIEVDAASRTKVEDTRELLDNVQYAPSVGRFKVYLIDEVHMLSNSSFNALLKTLEEPPAHVKFLLATTDPQKLPVTVLSRCLQFNLKNMPPERIVEHLTEILEKENVSAEPAALRSLSKAAEGSMRDALSLTDQAIAFGNGQLTAADVNDMLGSIDQSMTLALIQALIDGDAQALMTQVAHAAEQVIDYPSALAELLSTLHSIAIAQVLPGSVDNALCDGEQITHLAQSVTAEQLQLFYQIALIGRKDLSLSPDMRVGFEMVLLRMLAFRPQLEANLSDVGIVQEEPDSVKKCDAPVVGVDQLEARRPTVLAESRSGTASVLTTALTAGDTDSPEALKVAALESAESVEPIDKVSRHVDSGEIESVKGFNAGAGDIAEPVSPALKAVPNTHPVSDIRPEAKPEARAQVNVADLNAPPSTAPKQLSRVTPESWFDVYQALSVGGLLQNTLANCVLDKVEGKVLHLTLETQASALYDEGHQQRIASLLSDYFDEPVQVVVTLDTLTSLTPAAIIQEQLRERQYQAQLSIEQSPVVKALQTLFDAQIIPESIQPIIK